MKIESFGRDDTTQTEGFFFLVVLQAEQVPEVKKLAFFNLFKALAICSIKHSWFHSQGSIKKKV